MERSALVGIRPDGRAPAREGTVIEDLAGQPIGEVTSGGFGPTVGGPIALGYVRAAHAAPAAAAAVDPRQAASGQGGRAALRPPPLPALKECLPMSDVRYTKEHEWARLDGDLATVGISDYAQEQLGELVFVELPDIGRKVSRGGSLAVVESVKAASDVYAPVGGEVVETNGELANDPGLVNRSAEDEGWFCRLRIADRAS